MLFTVIGPYGSTGKQWSLLAAERLWKKHPTVVFLLSHQFPYAGKPQYLETIFSKEFIEKHGLSKETFHQHRFLQDFMTPERKPCVVEEPISSEGSEQAHATPATSEVSEISQESPQITPQATPKETKEEKVKKVKKEKGTKRSQTTNARARPRKSYVEVVHRSPTYK